VAIASRHGCDDEKGDDGRVGLDCVEGGVLIVFS
jgi:hypothetical protein